MPETAALRMGGLKRYMNYGGGMAPDPEGQWVHIGDISGVTEWALDPLIEQERETAYSHGYGDGLNAERLDRASWVDGYRAAQAKHHPPASPRAEVEAEFDRWFNPEAVPHA